MKTRKILSLLLSAILIFSLMQVAVAASPVWDNPPARVPANTNADLVDIELFGFKGSRIEFVDIPLEQPIEAGKYEYTLNVDMKNMWSTNRGIYVKPVAYDENSTFVINGTPHDFNVAYWASLGTVPMGGDPVTTPVVIEVTSGDGLTKQTYTLNIVNQDLYDRVRIRIIEEDLEKGTGVYQFTSIGGFASSEDCALFVGKDRAMLFDCLNGGGDGARRGGDLKKEVYKILTEKFGVANPDDFPIDVVITHAHGDHYGLVNSTTAKEYRMDGRGPGKGTVYWMIGNGNALSNAWHADPNTDVKMPLPGDIIYGPDFGKGALEFEVITVRTHEVGHLAYIYDNDADGQCTQNYIITGDCIGSGSYVFNHSNNNCIQPIFNRDMEKFWNRVKGFNGAHILSGHSWQERTRATVETGLAYVEDMYVASSMVMDDPFIGEFSTTSASAYMRQFAYGAQGMYYNDASAYDYRDNTLFKDKITPAHMLDLYLIDKVPVGNRVVSYTPLTTAYTYTSANADPMYLFTEAFGEDAVIDVTLNGAAVPFGFEGERGDRGYELKILASDNTALPGGVNNVEIKIADAASETSTVYNIYIRTINDNALYPFPNITDRVYSMAARPTIANGSYLLNDVTISAFKGGRLEPFAIPLDNPIIPASTKITDELLAVRDLTATVDSGIKTVYLVAEPTNPNLTDYTINGTKCTYPLPYKAEIKDGANVFTIVLGTGESAQTFTLTINSKALSSSYTTKQIEPGVWRIQDLGGFASNEDMYLFVGSDKATLFDTGMFNGDLRALVNELAGGKPIEVVITHNHGDHYAKVGQFADCKVYWPANDTVPASLNKDNFVYVNDGDTIVGPKFGEAPITFESIEVIGHTNGSMCYLYDNKAQGALKNSYLVTGDAVGSGSYVFYFGAGKVPMTTYAEDLKKLEAKIAKFADGFYDKDVSFKDVDGLYFLSGHSWQETENLRAMYSVMWNQSRPLQKLAGIEMVRDMRIAAEKVISGDWKGRLYTRNSGGVVEELRQMTYRQAGLWYSGWNVVPAATISAVAAPSAIVQGYAANIPVTVASSNLPSGASIVVYPQTNPTNSVAVVNGSATIHLNAADVSTVGAFTFVAEVAGTDIKATCSVEVCAAPANLWSPVVTVGPNSTVVTFASDVTFNAAKKAVTVAGAPVAGDSVTADGKVVTIAGTAAQSNDKVVISGVKYADLFPSYSFTFTLTYLTK